MYGTMATKDMCFSLVEADEEEVREDIVARIQTVAKIN